jgi:hypothetical protein
MSDSRPGASIVLHVLATAVALTALNALKPLTADDPSYYWHAQQIARHPLDPYGGTMVFREIVGPSVHNVAPPVALYWMALGLRVTGDDPQRLKLWLLPFALLLTGACSGLLQRFARGLEAPGIWLIALSPAILPSLNLMLDVPALALSLTAVWVFLRAMDRDSWPLAIGAGAIVGLAIQTKYTGFTVGAVLLAAGFLRGRPAMAVAACAVAGLMFVGWEAWVLGRYGESQFLYFLGRRERGETGPRSVLDLIRPLVRMLGPLASPLIPLGLVGLGAAKRWILLSMALVAGAHLALALVPEGAPERVLSVYNLTLGWLGPALLVIVAAVAWRLVGREWRETDVRLLALWLAIELLAYLFLSTFPAARRTLGLFTVLVVLTCALASRACRLEHGRRALVRGAAALSVALGGFYFVIDLDDARAERATVERVHSLVAGGGSGRVRYLATNWGGFQFYAPRAGFLPVVPGRSTFAPGDWLVVPWNIQPKNRLTLEDSSLSRVEALSWGARLPLSTRDAFYLGTRPIRRPDPDWRAAIVYRAVRGGRLVGVQEHPYQP